MSRQDIAVTVDCVIISGNKSILLIQRKNDPFKNQWALPGGFVEDEEDLETAALRELEEETGLRINLVKQIGAFGKPGRDPRGRMISVAYFGFIENEEEVKGSDDAGDAKWFKLSNLKDLGLAFDHDKIIENSKKFF